ncbi:MAG TPA: glycosyltransferase [Candidatus Paceibacterota bacterium]|nr:glycosyltransferase [Candidatus Paceibacterota bacterium]
MVKNFNPKVSIIIPVYNGSNYLKEAINSALAQTYENIEVIVINDGSDDKDETDKICKSYGKRIRYFKKGNGGVSSALNMGIKKMEGEYFSWLSHDDVYYPEKIERQIEYLSKLKDNSKVILYCNYELINEDSKHISFVEFNNKMLSRKPENALLRGCINGITLLIPKSAFDTYGGFNEELTCVQDYDMWMRLIEGYRFVHFPSIITKTRIHPEQGTNKDPNAIKEGNKLWIDLMEILSDEKKIELENSLYGYYYAMASHLEKSTYEKAWEYAKKKMNKISEKEIRKLPDVKVSVIIPFYNRINLVLKALESVINQTHKNLEILLIDDGSEEDTTKIKQCAETDKRIKIFTLDANKGPAFARNYGIERSKGDYISFLDSDDLFLPDKIESQLLMMFLTKWKVSHTSYIRRTNRNDELRETGFLEGVVIPEIIASCQIATPTVMIERKYLIENGYRFNEDLRLGEDVCFWLEILRNENLLGIPKVFTIVNIKSKTSSNNNEKQVKGISNILSYILSDAEYSKYYAEVGRLCYSYYEVSLLLGNHRGIPIYKDFSFWAKKPNNPFLKLIFLIKHQGFKTTFEKIREKYFGKN